MSIPANSARKTFGILFSCRAWRLINTPPLFLVLTPLLLMLWVVVSLDLLIPDQNLCCYTDPLFEVNSQTNQTQCPAFKDKLIQALLPAMSPTRVLKVPRCISWKWDGSKQMKVSFFAAEIRAWILRKTSLLWIKEENCQCIVFWLITHMKVCA